MALLLDRLREADAHEQAAALLARDPAAHAPLNNPYGVALLLDRLQGAGADEQAAALAARAAAHAPLDNPYGVASLLDRLRWAGAQDEAAALLARDPAAHAALDDPHGVAHLLYGLREAGADEQVAALASRTASYAPLNNPRAAADLLHILREAGAHKQAAALTDRLPAAGLFGLFLEQKGLADQFRFGQEADGTPAARWGWEDLDLWVVPRQRGQAAPAGLSRVPARRNGRLNPNNPPPIRPREPANLSSSHRRRQPSARNGHGLSAGVPYCG